MLDHRRGDWHRAPMTMIDYLLSRRSVKAALLGEPAPDAAQLRQMLTAAMRVPDHGKLAPWRIRVLHKTGQAKLGAIYAQLFAEANPQATEKQIEFERQRPQLAPLLVAVLHTPIQSHIPVWEQELSTGALCMNLIHATHALGFAANWLTEWPAFHDEVRRVLGGGDSDRIAGLIYIGTPTEKPDERPRPAYDEIVSIWEG